MRLVPLLFLLVACSSHAEPEPASSAWSEVTGERVTVAWRADGGLVRNEDMDVELRVTNEGAPVAGAAIDVRGWMPDHGHGMVREPAVREVGGGHYVVEGLLLHMRGHWDVDVSVKADGWDDTARIEVDL